LFIDSKNESFDLVSVYNIPGKLIFKGKYKKRIPVSDLPTGLYLIVLQNDHQSFEQKFFKE